MNNNNLSRRDVLYESLGTIRDTLHEIQTAEATSNGNTGTGPSSPARARASSTSNIHPVLGAAQSNINSYLNRLSSLQGGRHGSPINGPPVGMREQAMNALATGTSRAGYQIHGPIDPASASNEAQASYDRQDALPGYTPRTMLSQQVVKYQHSLSSSNKKIQLILESAGSKQHPVYVQDVLPQVKGKVILKLQGDESVNEVRIRVKGVVTTCLKRVQASSRSMADEVEFWYSSTLLWTATDAQPTLDVNKELEFPFSMTIPNKIPISAQIRKNYDMPPSFVLNALYTNPGGVDSASIRYYVKVTIARKGLLRPNDRLFAPIVYLSRRTDVGFLSDARRAFLVQGIELPNPVQAPDNWQGRVEDRELRKGVFGTKKCSYKVALLLPKPLVYGKIENLPYYIRISSTDSDMLQKLDGNSIVVALMQRTVVFSQGIPAMHETAVVRGQTDLAADDQGGITEQARRYKGVIQLSKAPSTSFRTFNIEVSYYLKCSIVDRGALQETIPCLPIAIVSIPPVARNAAEVQQTNSATRTEAHTAAERQAVMQTLEEEEPDLPPDYFDVVDQDRRT